MSKFYDKLICTSFATCILGFAIWGIVLPDEAKSIEENRVLAQKPTLTWESLVSGDYMAKMESYINDQFPLRGEFVAAKSQLEILQGKKDSNGVYFGDDDYLLQILPTPEADRIDKNVAGLLDFSAKHPDYNIDMFLIPTSTWALSDKLPTFATPLDELLYANQVEQGLADSNVNFGTAFDILKDHADEEIYYGTDHHYTSLGAYYAYVALSQQLGYEPLSQEDFLIQTVSEDFYGTLHSKGLFNNLPYDSIQIYENPNLEVEITVLDDGSNREMYDFEMLKEWDKYAMFLGGNAGYMQLSTNVQNGKTLNIVKDSFANALIPFLANHYETINVFDLRYYRVPFEQMLGEGEKDFLIFYNMSSYLQEGTVYQIKYL